MEAKPMDTLDYIEDVDDNNNEDQMEKMGAFEWYRGDHYDDFDVDGDTNDADNNADDATNKDDNDNERNDNDETSATSEEEIDGDEDRQRAREKNTEEEKEKTTGKQDAKKKEEMKPFKFKEEMENVCQCLAFTHGHRMEKDKQMQRLIKAFGKKKKWSDLRAKREDDEKKVMMHKFNKDMKLRF